MEEDAKDFAEPLPEGVTAITVRLSGDRAAEATSGAQGRGGAGGGCAPLLDIVTPRFLAKSSVQDIPLPLLPRPVINTNLGGTAAIMPAESGAGTGPTPNL